MFGVKMEKSGIGNLTDFISSKDNSKDIISDTAKYHGETFMILGSCLAFVSGITAVFSVICVKFYPVLFGNLQNQPVILFWASSTGAVLSTVVMFAMENPVLPENVQDYFLVIFHGITYIVCYPVYLYASCVLDGNTLNIFWTTSTVYMVIAQYTVLKDIHPGHRNWIEMVGAGLVILGCIISPLIQLIKKKCNRSEREDC